MLSLRYSLASMVGMATTFFLDIFCFMLWLIRQLLEEKDSKNTCKKNIQYKVAQQVFHEYLLEKGIAEPTEKSEIA